MPNLDEFFPFDVGYGYPANTARWRKMAQLWQSDGVFTNYLNQLNATQAGTTVTIATGGLFVHGYYGEVQNPMSITGVGTNGTIVAGVDLVQQTVSIYYRDQVVDYGANIAQNYQQDINKWEIPLWLITASGTPTDLRTMVTPGVADTWWGSAVGTVNVPSSTSVSTPVMTCRVPFPGKAIIRGELLLTFTDASQAQTAACSLTYQWGQGDQQLSPTMTPSTAAGTMMGPYNMVVPLSGLIPVTQGKKTVGWRVTAGTGPALTLATLIASLQIVNLPATN